MIIGSKTIALVIASVLLGTITFNQAYSLKGSDATNDKEINEANDLRSNQSDALNLTNGSTLGSPIIGTVIGKAIGNSANSDDDEAKKQTEFALQPNQSDSLSPD